MTYYYAGTDENGVLCVDQVSSESTEEGVASLAVMYPDAIYFEVTPPPPLYSYKEAVTRIRQALVSDDDAWDVCAQIESILERTVK